jgi:isoleucyl-tRNA synthetase
MARDYKSTVFLPKTDFPMKGGLPQLEPRLLDRWQQMGLYKLLRQQSKDRPKFVLHDGPPYANGNIHIGHALNKILKDVVNRMQQMLGKDANYVPGWDCHGLPIEWKIEEKYRAEGRDKDQVPVIEFRRECREFAEHWIKVQKAEFKRLGVEGDWDNPYTTMSYAAEAQIARELHKFLMKGALYRGAKAVLWSPVEKTALAEAEVEYHEHKSNTIHVRFPVAKASAPRFEGASVLIWTTTPWTIPGNRAVAFAPDADYAVIEVAAVGEKSLAVVGEKLIMADKLVGEVAAAARFTPKPVGQPFQGAALAGTVARHPLAGHGYDLDSPLFPADFVTTDDGTGLVHIAPGHGNDDFELGAKQGLEVPATVDEDGTFYPNVPLFAGKHVYKVDGEVANALQQAGKLLAGGTLSHSYPHSWRSKAPLIFRNAPQWFISMSTTGLRDTALKAVEQVRWVPPSGKNRMRGMVENRPDWVISRQRAWGVPLAIFVDKATGEPLKDPQVNDRIAQAFEQEGADAWYASGNGARFLGPGRDPAQFEKIDNIVEVWFDSGSTHAFVLEQRPDLAWPADVYLEGSDQHRGWFGSSLMVGCGTRGRAPYNTVLTHGFIMDAEGKNKMSKSLGNTIAPQTIMDQHGADILRLWVMSADYTEDISIGADIIKAQVEAYRKLRNTLRYLLGALAGFTPSERVPHGEMPELERWVLHRLSELGELVRECCESFDFHKVFVALYTFCTVDLSAIYFDIRKDSLYCDAAGSARRRAVRTVMDEVFSCLTAWLAPILVFTAEEAWLARFPGDASSVHLRTFPAIPAAWRDEALAAKWAKIRALRRVVTGALEIERKEKRIGASLQAAPTVYATAEHIAALKGIDLAEIAITSDASLVEGAPPAGAFTLEDVPGVGVVSSLAQGRKCERCWQVLEDVGADPQHPDLCGRCADAVGKLAA